MAVSSPRIPKRKSKFNWTPYLFLAVPLIVYLVWIIGPVLYTFYLSVTDWDGISPEAKYIGLKNFDTLFSSLGNTLPSAFEFALFNNLKWLLVFITVPVAVGLGLAVLLNQGIRGDRVFKMGIFLLEWMVISICADGQAEGRT